MKSIFKKITYLIIFILLFEGAYAEGKNALLKSLILPGWGEKAMGEESRSKILMYTDIAIIFTHLMGKSFENWYIDEYSGYAELYANADMNTKDYAFVLNMSSYNSMDEYNQDMSNQRNWNSIYDDSNYNWNWDSTDNRYKFNDMREKSVIAKKFAEFAIAGLIINRFVSFVDVLYLKNLESGLEMNAYLVPEKYDGLSLNISFSSK